MDMHRYELHHLYFHEHRQWKFEQHVLEVLFVGSNYLFIFA